MPVVLGPDHPTTGGYPVLATVITGDFGSLAARPPGARVRFVTQP
jgi:allophanate hydrolase subunit 2